MTTADAFKAQSDFHGEFHGTFGRDSRDLSEVSNEELRQIWIDIDANDGWPEATAVVEAELSSRAPTYTEQRVHAYLSHVTDVL